MEPAEPPHGVEESGPARGRSRWWYLAPLLLAIVGGVVAYFALRRDDPRLARNCLVLGIALTVVSVAVQAAIVAADPLP
ncbi:MAG: hypothetical protein OXU86_07160 [Thaumarchaeota archaeon]|nr:hypothetical protein [Nitrososphaerota archaeon]MDD9812840.1 hypothetical protein [Nitrososphaerota archaeon]MDD9826529.1 hypothetical protein [Nitrososphaerota archaeon]MDD9842492.1 hypothetical protein [Nitrososphaerota archaeon]RNJ73493.1 MAG: hypothetical protein EB833_02695 [Thaumarchaeota archaeon S13]